MQLRLLDNGQEVANVLFRHDGYMLNLHEHSFHLLQTDKNNCEVNKQSKLIHILLITKTTEEIKHRLKHQASLQGNTNFHNGRNYTTGPEESWPKGCNPTGLL